MSRIIKPQGRAVRRITIVVDQSGQAVLEAENLDIPGTPRPMMPREVEIVLSQILATTIVGNAAAEQRRAKTQKEDNNGSL